jgi:hypothetical protein
VSTARRAEAELKVATGRVLSANEGFAQIAPHCEPHALYVLCMLFAA